MILGSVVSVGIIGYMVLEGWSFVESLYMTIITLSTVGFSEVRPLSPPGRIFTAGLILAGVGAMTYLFAAISQYIISGELTGSLRKARMQQRIDALSGHYVICGFGRWASRSCSTWKARESSVWSSRRMPTHWRTRPRQP
jgi:voltage-gated potassium channel